MRRTLNILVVIAALALIGFAVAALLGIRAEYDRGNNAYENLNSEAVQSNTGSTIFVEARTEDSGGSAAEEPGEQAPITVDFDKLLEQNPDVRGWVYCEGTNISYPILQGQDNQYYVHRLIDGSEAVAGSIFMDYRNSPNFSDLSTVIYGHHMRDGTMFGSLEDYRSQSFYDLYPTMTLYTPEGDYRIEFFSGTSEDGDYEFVEFNFDSDEAFMNYVQDLRARSEFTSDVEVQPGDRLISLCTCAYNRLNARFMLVGKLVPIYAEKNSTDDGVPPAGS